MRVEQCVKCGQSMEDAFLIDHRRQSSVRPLEWREGKPERFLHFFLKLHGKPGGTVSALRCTNCGYLELYAPLRST